MSQALYRKYRPKDWAEVIDQDHIVQTIKNAIAADRVGHAYLFAGPRGTGKTTIARLLGKAVNCLAEDPKQRPCNSCENCKAVNENRFLDLIEMDAASYTGVDDVRELRDKIGFSPSQGKFKVYIIDEVHMLSTSAFNALLKTLEEPPPHAIFVLATTEIHKIPATVLSRCQRHEFRRVGADDIITNLRHIVRGEGFEAEDEALLLIARQATGSIRDAQSMLDQLASLDSKITLEKAQSVLGTATNQAVLELLDLIRDGNAAGGMKSLRAALDAGADPRTLARQIVEYLRAVMLMQLGNADQVEATKEAKDRMASHAKAFSSGAVLDMMKGFNQAATESRGGWQPSLSLELALVEVLEHGAEAPRVKPMPPASSGSPMERSRSEPPTSHAPQEPTAVSTASARTSATVGPQILYQDGPEQADGPQVAAAGPATGRTNGGVETAGITISQVLGAWKEIRAAIKPTHPGVEALLNSCRPMEVAGNALLLGFQSETVRALMNKSENLEAAGKAIVAVLGSPLEIKCVVINAHGKLPPNVQEDGMVATALDHGGEIVDVQE